MDCVIIVMTNQVEHTKGISLNNNWTSESLHCQVYLNNPHTLHDTIRRDTTRQLLTRKSCNVRVSATQNDTTRQKSGLVVSDLTMLDIYDKARFLSCRVIDPRILHDFLVRGCRIVSRRVNCGRHKMFLRAYSDTLVCASNQIGFLNCWNTAKSCYVWQGLVRKVARQCQRRMDSPMHNDNLNVHILSVFV